MCKIGAVLSRGGVEDTMLEAKDTKKSEVKAKDSPTEDRPSRGQGQECSRPRTGMLEAKAKHQEHKRNCSPKKKERSSQKIFQLIFRKKRFPKNFSGAPQTFNNSKNSAVLEPRIWHFLRT